MNTRNERWMHELHAYHDGELGWFARWRVERRLARDPAARAELAGFADLGDLLREGEAAATTPDLWPGLRGQLPTRRAEPTEDPTLEGLGAPRRLGFPAWAPAGLAVAAVAALIAFGIGGGEAPAPHSVRWLDTGGQSAMVLQDDGEATIIWILDGGEQTRGLDSRRGERAFI